jgi:hypothetical protein
MAESLGVSRATLREAIKTLGGGRADRDPRRPRGLCAQARHDEIARHDRDARDHRGHGRPARGGPAGHRGPRRASRGWRAAWRPRPSTASRRAGASSTRSFTKRSWRRQAIRCCSRHGATSTCLLSLFMQRINPGLRHLAGTGARNHDSFVGRAVQKASPDEAERVVRQIIVSTGFRALGEHPSLPASSNSNSEGRGAKMTHRPGRVGCLADIRVIDASNFLAAPSDLHASGRSRRGRDQDRAAGFGRRTARMGKRPRRRGALRQGDQPQQAVGLRRSAARRWARRRQPSRQRRRPHRRELPSGHHGEVGPGLRGAQRDQSTAS